MNLYMISLGGKAKGCNIEVHDVQFAAASHIDETVELLKARWYGLGEKLHMDSYKLLNGAQGYSIRLTKEKPVTSQKLYFVHFGGYKTESTQELHDIGLFVGSSDKEVKDRAEKEFLVADIENHVDSLILVEDVILSAEGEKYYIELSESTQGFDLAPDWFGYRRLDLF
jgi:hypothetical protein